MLKVESLYFEYSKKPTLTDVSFHAPKGTLCGLFGPNGSGKSTLFKCCLNFLKPSRGVIEIDGKNVSKITPAALAKIISYVPQEHKPPFPFTAREIVLMGRSPHMGGIFGLSKKDYEEASYAMDLMEISDIADIPCSNLSGGQRQLTLIARAVAQKTPIMFLDEPTGALDFSNQIKTWQMLKKVAASGVTVIACSHDPNHILWFSDRIIALAGGKIIAEGMTKDTLNESLLYSIYKKPYKIGVVDGNKIILPPIDIFS